MFVAIGSYWGTLPTCINHAKWCRIYCEDNAAILTVEELAAFISWNSQ
jgi:hypothetical protein